MSASGEIASARVERESGSRWTRVLPLLAVLLALFLLREAWKERGPRVVVRAADGHGLRPGDSLRYRGIEVGKVESLELDGETHEVLVGVRLARSASDLARGGARFWIARPVLGVEGVRGLETALGARYLAVLPGSPGAPRQSEFVALEEPPLFESESPDALEIVLQASQRAGLVRGAPVTYRGIPIGTLVSVALAGDATAVEAHARILAPYSELVRTDSRFHRTHGADISLGLGGLELTVESLQSLWLGGVALCTPTHPGPRASTGQRFALASGAEDEWLAWRPALPVGGGFPGGDLAAPERLWAHLSWKTGSWLARRHSREGWLVPRGNEFLGPADLLEVPAEAEGGRAILELGGQSHELVGAPTWSADGLAAIARDGASTGDLPRTRAAREAEDLLLWADPALVPMAVAASHLTPGEGGFSVDPALPLDERWHGALALARADGAWVGILLVADGRGRIVSVPSR